MRFLLLATVLWTSCAFSQSYPSKPVRWIVSTGPGSGEPPAEFAAYVRAEMQKWGKVIKDANIKIE